MLELLLVLCFNFYELFDSAPCLRCSLKWFFVVVITTLCQSCVIEFNTDPTPVLEHALQLQKKAQKAQDLEMENRQLRDRLEEYTNEFAEVKNQGKNDV